MHPGHKSRCHCSNRRDRSSDCAGEMLCKLACSTTLCACYLVARAHMPCTDMRPYEATLHWRHARHVPKTSKPSCSGLQNIAWKRMMRTSDACFSSRRSAHCTRVCHSWTHDRCNREPCWARHALWRHRIAAATSAQQAALCHTVACARLLRRCQCGAHVPQHVPCAAIGSPAHT
jgi:hypothetical protein